MLTCAAFAAGGSLPAGAAAATAGASPAARDASPSASRAARDSALPRPGVAAWLPAAAGSHARPRLTIVVRHAPRGARVLLQERIHARWATRGSAAVRGDRTLRLRWRGLRGRAAVQLRVVLADRRGRTLAATSPRRVQRTPARPAPRPPTPQPTPQPAPPAPAGPPAPRPGPPVPELVPNPTPTPDGPLVLAADALRLHSLGADRWDVWTCGDVGDATAADAVSALDAQVVPFYTWLSGGRYALEFRARGALASSDVEDCAAEAAQESAGRDGALIVQTERISAGADACVSDLTRLDPCAGQPTVLPGNERIAWLSPGTLLGPGAHIATAVHELGHALTWTHSNTGRLHVDYQGSETAIEYDDPFDVMGYERLWGTGAWADPSIGTFTPKATQAFNRIAAGWVPDSAITVHDRAAATYSLGPLDDSGLQVVIVPTADPRAFLTLEARVQQQNDPVPGEGVVVHAVDQRPAACDTDPAADALGCWAEQVRVSPAPNTPDSLDSLVTAGESVAVAGVRITVGARDGDRFTVTVAGAQAAFAPLAPTVCLYAPALCPGGGQGPL